MFTAPNFLGNLYAKAPIVAVGPPDFDQVTDSSRYFVIRLKNDAGQTAFVGVGFADRSDSFDLNVAIQDHFKAIKKEEEQSHEDVSKPKLDLSFKEGQTITVNIGVSFSISIDLQSIGIFRRRPRRQPNVRRLMEAGMSIPYRSFHLHLPRRAEDGINFKRFSL